MPFWPIHLAHHRRSARYCPDETESHSVYMRLMQAGSRTFGIICANVENTVVGGDIDGSSIVPPTAGRRVLAMLDPPFPDRENMLYCVDNFCIDIGEPLLTIITPHCNELILPYFNLRGKGGGKSPVSGRGDLVVRREY